MPPFILRMYRLANLDLHQTLNEFCKMLHEFFGRRLVSIGLYGSAVFDDLAPRCGDLDFVTFIDDTLSLEDCQRLTELRKPLRQGERGVFAAMVEGAFLPENMLDPA